MSRLLRGLELKLPPPVVTLLALGLMLKLAYLTPAFRIALPGRFVIGIVVAGLGIAITIAGFRALRRADTTISPLAPHKIVTLVTGGVYARTRNPMYLGLVLVLIGIAAAAAHPLALMVAMLAAWYLDRFQIQPEERVLSERLGSVYRAYTARVRRWL